MDQEELDIFLSESYDTLNSLDTELIMLSKNPEATDVLENIHNNYHSFLESSKFMKFGKLESLTHVGERLIDQIRKSESTVSNEIITTILKLNTTLREIVFTIDETKKEPSHFNSSIVSDVEEVIIQAEQDEQDDEADLLLTGAPGSTTNTTESEIMDKLMPVLVELFNTKETLLEFNSEFKNLSYYQTVTRLSSLIKDMYETVREARNQAIGSMVLNLDRVMKDLARERGKSATLKITGREKEIDSKLLETIRICLIQLVKNSIDHGIESPEERISLDKEPDGFISVECSYLGELFQLVYTDDGDGIDPAKIKMKFISKNILLTDEAEKIPDEEITDYIFKDGYFGMNEIGTFVGGRPSGFDIIKARVEMMGGRVYLQNSIRQKGVEIHITLPLINAIVPVLSVGFSNERYAIAKVHLLEIIRIDSESLVKRIDTLVGFPVFVHKEKKYPLLYMKQILKIEDSEPTSSNPVVNLLILENTGMKFALVADSVEDEEQVIVRSLSPQISGIYLFSGMTLLQDGSPSLILDVGEIKRRHLGNRDLQMALSEQETSDYSMNLEIGADL
ncbi:MAG: chemotaxis protein CheW [Leptospiraceae bacterium]|nr:chemotaxis protein CheW [Leptospiraceae bacterium]